MQEDSDFIEINFENIDRELKKLSHQQLWGCKATAAVRGAMPTTRYALVPRVSHAARLPNNNYHYQ